MLRIVPLTLKEANALVRDKHRHHKPVVGARWSIGVESDGNVVGAAIVGRPVARMTNQYRIAEVTRLVTDGTKNACSILYACAARICREMGFSEIRTAILESESGHSLKVSGWKFSHWTDGGDWNRPSRGGRRTDQPMCRKQIWKKILKRDSNQGPEVKAPVIEEDICPSCYCGISCCECDSNQEGSEG